MPAQSCLPVSVLMPVRNGASTVDAAMASMMKQSLHDFELIVVDDGSSDNTPERLRSWAAQDSRIRVQFHKARGIVPSLNDALDGALGRYIARMDADDVSHPDRLKCQLEFLDQNEHVDVASCLVEYGGCAEQRAGYADYVTWVNSIVSPEDIALQRFVESPLPHPSVMFRRELWERHGGYAEGEFPEDYELWLRWLEAGACMAKVPQTLLTWSDADSRLSRQDPRYAVEAFYACKSAYLARWLEASNPHHPHVTIWGAGRTSRQRAELLKQYGICIKGYIDVDPAKVGQRIHDVPVMGPDDLPAPDSCFIISYVGSRGARAKICEALEQRGYTLGQSYICAA